MNYTEAIETLKKNYPCERYSMLRESVDLAIKALGLADQNGAKVIVFDPKTEVLNTMFNLADNEAEKLKA